jgi:hypothetical protein
MSRRDTKWFAPPSGGYSPHCEKHDRPRCSKCPPIERGAPPKNPSSTSAGRKKEPVQKIVLVCGCGWGKQMTLEEWEALYREFMEQEEE